MDIQNEIIKTIELMVNKAIGDSFGIDFNGVVTGITDKGTYKVSYNGETIETYDAVGCDPSIGSSVWLHYPLGSKAGSMYIAGLRSKSASGAIGGTSGSVPTYGLGIETDNGKRYIVLTKNGVKVSRVEDVSGTPISKTSQLTNDSNFISDSNYIHTDNNYTSEDKIKVSNIKYATNDDISNLFTGRGLA